MRPRTPIIALLSDFGEKDHYVGTMKGVIASIAPKATIIDISHSVERHDVNAAAYVLWAAHRFFPQRTIFVCVVDPGVGGARDVICVKTRRHTFLAPDNGLLKYILAEERDPSAVAVRNRRLFLPTVSNTFHGRDIFAPVAGHLANGVPSSRLGPRVKPVTGKGQFVSVGTKPVQGIILYIDRFGNLVTNVRVDDSTRIAVERMRVSLRGGSPLGERAIAYAPTYVTAPRGTPFFTIGSTGLLEISVKNGSAAQQLKAEVGTAIEVTAGDGG